MEGFDGMMRIAIHNRWIRGFQIGGRAGEEMEICHLLYADDTVIFCEPNAEQICYIILMLIVFEVVADLRVNWGKSTLFPVKEVPHIQNLASMLRCRVENLPTTYLVMPLETATEPFGVGVWRTIGALWPSMEENLKFKEPEFVDLKFQTLSCCLKVGREECNSIKPEHDPSIIFMDEIDSIGSARMESGSGNGDSEVQRTMLELLNQLDGFEASNIIKASLAIWIT
ncbi:uncharacterized protein LOC132639471 [Lycium barbarum]|uniref:uncharacterized protein LOC132639471 n=1 Tax=Lycium barbarum TaxID=112863 RepID=UPI00293E2DDE|nr:uncharacterized protein LOC132639471 [Lycium barbarum]